jgi:hypothetical protein
VTPNDSLLAGFYKSVLSLDSLLHRSARMIKRWLSYMCGFAVLYFPAIRGVVCASVRSLLATFVRLFTPASCECLRRLRAASCS